MTDTVRTVTTGAPVDLGLTAPDFLGNRLTFWAGGAFTGEAGPARLLKWPITVG
jgi:hypothetical protein